MQVLAVVHQNDLITGVLWPFSFHNGLGLRRQVDHASGDEVVAAFLVNHIGDPLLVSTISLQEPAGGEGLVRDASLPAILDSL